MKTRPESVHNNTSKSPNSQDINLFSENDPGLKYLVDPDLFDIVCKPKMPPKKRLVLAKKLTKWALLLRKSVSLNTKVEIGNYDNFLTNAHGGMWSVFVEEPDIKKIDTATVGRIMSRYKFWAEELELEIKRRLTEMQLGNPQN